MRKTRDAVELAEAERARLRILRMLVGRWSAPARTLTHARILLKANHREGGTGWADAAIAGALEVHPATAARVHRRTSRTDWTPPPPAGRPIACIRAPSTGRRKPAWSPHVKATRRTAASGGRCACWPGAGTAEGGRGRLV